MIFINMEISLLIFPFPMSSYFNFHLLNTIFQNELQFSTTSFKTELFLLSLDFATFSLFQVTTSFK